MRSIPSHVDVAIIGAGPAGLATAIALQQAVDPGTSLAVFEAREGSGERGAVITTDINGLRAVEAINPSALHRIYTRGIYARRFEMYDEGTGELLPRQVTFDPSAQLQQHGHATVNVHWWEITSALQDAMPQGLVHTGLKLFEAAEEHDPDASQPCDDQDNGDPYRYRLVLQRTASSTDGRNPGPDDRDSSVSVRAKWLIGADGFFSRVRRMVGDSQAPAFAGEVCWWGSVPQAQLQAAGAQWPEPLRQLGGARAKGMGLLRQPAHTARATRAAIFMRTLTGRSAGGDQEGSADGGEESTAGGEGSDLIWYLRAAAEDLEGAGLQYPCPAGPEGSEPPALRRALAVFSHLPPEAMSLLRATRPERVTERGIYTHDIERLQEGSFTNGRGTVWVGDAVHATRPDGQGLNLSFEDAAVLGACVRTHGLSQEAFDAYEAARIARVKAILLDSKPPFATRTALVNGASFAPLWSPCELPAPEPLASHEEGLAWSRDRVRRIVEEKAGIGKQGPPPEATPVGKVAAVAARAGSH